MGYVMSDFKRLGLQCDKSALDFLTGVLSREAITSVVSDYIKAKKPFSLFIIDLDNFKKINDNYGHLTGDMVLKVITERLLDILPETSALGRYGGDEFLIVAPELQEYQDRWSFVKKFYSALRFNINLTLTDEAYITATTGGAAYPLNATTFEELFMKADKALYRGKEKGRNCFIIYDDEKHSHIEIKKKEDYMHEAFNDILEMVGNHINPSKLIPTVCGYLENLCHLKCFFISSFDEALNYYPYDDQLNPRLLKDLLADKSYKVARERKSLSNSYYELFKNFQSKSIDAYVIERVGTAKRCMGYLIFAGVNVKRIWQKDELVLFNYVANMLAMKLLSYLS